MERKAGVSMRSLYDIAERFLEELPGLLILGAMILFGIWLAASAIVRLFGPAY